MRAILYFIMQEPYPLKTAVRNVNFGRVSALPIAKALTSRALTLLA